MTKVFVMVEVELRKPVPNLAQFIAQRTYVIDGVKNAEAWIQGKDMRQTYDELEKAGFTPEEISLGSQEVERG